MPELPEVETIRLRLRDGTTEHPSVVGREIRSADLFWERTLAFPDPVCFTEAIRGQKILDVQRRGKYFVFPLTSGFLLIHLRMSGDLIVGKAGDDISKHYRLVLNLSGGVLLAFDNPRKFGRVWLVDDPASVLGVLGPEPLDPALTQELFFGMLHARKRQLKPLLMDQHFLAGLGNIYTDEALFRAGLHPKVLSDTLDRQAAGKLLAGIRDVLREGIRRNGASIDWIYRGGDFQNCFFVYQRTGQPCLRCGTPVRRIVLGQRGTHFCPVCQPFPENRNGLCR